ncbi:MAG TPA: hydantoinase B/oxoprolinase family protein [bacterium]|nr:hydantoinase B/oxoprolinase family protein [bacterium]
MGMNVITLEVLRHRLFAIAEEMGTALVRTAYATNIKDRRDCSCALFTADGDTIAQAEHIPIHLGVLPWAVKGALRHVDVATLRPGDAVIHNDPYIGGTHTPDIIIFAPIFYQGRLVAFVGNLAHHIDVGGLVPGSLSPQASEIFHEGLRLPPVKIRKAGKLDPELLAIHGHNVRTAYECRGDLLAQLAANNVGEQRFIELCEEFGIDTVLNGITELADYCDRRMAVELAALPAGTYEFADVIEGDGHCDTPFTIQVRISASDGRLHVDFTGTSPQAVGPINAVRPMTLACVYYVIKAITDPSIPPNVGTFRRIDVVTPEGTIVNARFPAPTGFANGITCQRLADVMLGALAQAVPERVCAAATGAMNGLQLGGFDAKRRTYFSHVESYGGGYGAAYDQDGTSGVHTHMTNTRNAPVEVLETVLPVRVECYGLVPDSEGPGRHRGGFGITRIVTILTDNVECTMNSDRMHTPPWGLAGGKPARGVHFRLENGEKVREMPAMFHERVDRGDRFVIETAGGGGWGDPLERAPEQVLIDVQDGLISPTRAAEAYGVVIDSQGHVDVDATARLREAMGR